MTTWKKVASSALALSLVVGLVASPVYADNHGKDRGKKEQKHNNGKKKGHYKFFVDEDEAQWAINAIIKMASKKVFIGDQYGYFNPNKPITRAEATVAAVRLMGLEETVRALGNVDLNFKDAKEIDRNFNWAEGYIYVGLENGLFDAGMSSFEPNKPASREWVATILVRALGLEGEANKKMNTKLDFKDAKAISATAVGYVAVAVEKGLVTGYTDRTFQPNKAITRAEMAALLDRMDWIYDAEVSGVKGSIYSVSATANQLQVKRANGDIVTVTYQDSTYIMLNGKLATKDQIKAGQQVTVVFNDSRETILIDLKGDAPPVLQDWESGQITAFSMPSGTSVGIVQLTVNNQQVSYYVNNQTKVFADGLELQLADLGLGQHVTFRTKDQHIVEIKVVGQVKQVSGVIKQIIAPSNNQIGFLVVTTITGDVNLPLSSNVRYIYNGKEIELSNLAIGSTIEATTLDHFVKRVKVVQANITDYSGTIKTIEVPTNTRVGKLEILSNKESKTFYFTANTKIQAGNLALHISDLYLAQKVNVKVDNEFLQEIKVEGKVTEHVGKITAITYPSSKGAGSISIIKDGKTTTLTFAPQFKVTNKANAVDVKAVIVGDVVNITTFNSKVKEIEIKDKSIDTVYDYAGTIVNVVVPTAQQAGLLELQLDQNNRKTFILNNTVIKSGGLELHATDLSVSQQVSVKVVDNVLKEVSVEGKVEAYEGKVVAVLAPTDQQIGAVTIEQNGKQLTYILAAQYSITQFGKAVKLSDIEVGDHVQLMTFNNTIKGIDIKEKNESYTHYLGTLVKINLPDGEQHGLISVLTNSNELVTLVLHQDVKVYDQEGKVISLADLSLLNSIEVEMKEALVTKITKR